MPAPAWESLGDFLSLDDFATPVRVTQADGATRTINCIFDEPYYNAELGEYDMASGEPRLTCKESDAAGLKKHDQCVVHGAEYELMHDPYPDGTGMAVVKLMRV